MNTRRHFLKKVGVGSVALAAFPLLNSPLVQAASGGTANMSNGSSALPVGSWELNYDGKLSKLVLSRDASGNLTGTLSGQPISPSWNKNDRVVTFVGKFDPSKNQELQVFTGLFFEATGSTPKYIAGWAESSNSALGAEHKRVVRWYAR